MTDRPILFSAPMVRALLDGSKTQTRRLMTPSNTRLYGGDHIGMVKPSAELLTAALEWAQDFRFFGGTAVWRGKAFKHQAPAMFTQWQASSTFGVPGDALWVRETWKPYSRYARMRPRDMPHAPVFYRAASSIASSNAPWVPSIHMPRWASRIALRITDVRVERLNDISEADALAEGVVWSDQWQGFIVPGVAHPNKDFPVLSRATAREMYAALWDTINGSGEWLANPWIWAVSFERTT